MSIPYRGKGHGKMHRRVQTEWKQSARFRQSIYTLCFFFKGVFSVLEKKRFLFLSFIPTSTHTLSTHNTVAPSTRADGNDV